MKPYGVLGDKEPFCDIAIPISLGDLAESINFTIREAFIAEMFRKMIQRDGPLFEYKHRTSCQQKPLRPAPHN